MSTETADRGDLEGKWRSFFREHSQEEIKDLIGRYPDDRSLSVDVLDLHAFDVDFTEAVLSEPDRSLRAARDALAGVHESFDRVHVRLENHPGLIGIADLRSRHVGEFVTIEGVVAECGPVHSTLAEAVYACEGCGNAVRTHPTGTHLSSPRYCSECEASDTFDLRRARSTFVDRQRVRFADPGEDGDRTVDVYLDDDLVGTVSEGEQLLVTGVVRLDRRGSKNRFEFVIDANAIQEERAPPEEEGDAAGLLEDTIEEHWQAATDG